LLLRLDARGARSDRGGRVLGAFGEIDPRALLDVPQDLGALPRDGRLRLGRHGGPVRPDQPRRGLRFLVALRCRLPGPCVLDLFQKGLLTMSTKRFSLRLALLALGAVLAAVPALGARASDDALSLVPSDAAAVCVVRWNELRASPIGARILSQSDNIT